MPSAFGFKREFIQNNLLFMSASDRDAYDRIQHSQSFTPLVYLFVCLFVCCCFLFVLSFIFSIFLSPPPPPPAPPPPTPSFCVHFVCVCIVLCCCFVLLWCDTVLLRMFSSRCSSPRRSETGVLLQRPHGPPAWSAARPSCGALPTRRATPSPPRSQVKGQRSPPPFKTEGWKLKLPPITEAGPFVIEVSSGDGQVTLNDVLFGDVYLCSGQSNMKLEMGKVLFHSALNC